MGRHEEMPRLALITLLRRKETWEGKGEGGWRPRTARAHTSLLLATGSGCASGVSGCTVTALGWRCRHPSTPQEAGEARGSSQRGGKWGGVGGDWERVRTDGAHAQ